MPYMVYSLEVATMTTEKELMPCQNTDIELYREIDGDYYANSIHVTENGGIGMNVGGTVIVKSIADWHYLDSVINGNTRTDKEAELAELREELSWARYPTQVRLLRMAGCTCHKPLVGHKPPLNFTRCRLCNTETEGLETSIDILRASLKEAEESEERWYKSDGLRMNMLMKRGARLQEAERLLQLTLDAFEKNWAIDWGDIEKFLEGGGDYE